MTFQLIYWGTYAQIHPKVYLPVYLHASLSSNHEGLPVITTICVHARRCTHSWPYVFTLRLSFWLTIKIYLFMLLLFYMSIDVPVHQHTCSVCFFFFGVTCTMTFQLIYWGTYTQIHPKIYLPVYLHAFLLPNHIGEPTCHHNYLCTYICSWPYLFIFTLTAKIYLSMFLLSCMSTSAPVHQYTCSVYFFFFSITCTMTFQLIYRGTYTQIYL